MPVGGVTLTCAPSVTVVITFTLSGSRTAAEPMALAGARGSKRSARDRASGKQDG